jgi:hypothetical protein
MINHLRRLIAATVIFLACSSSAVAQEPRRIDIAGGYASLWSPDHLWADEGLNWIRGSAFVTEVPPPFKLGWFLSAAPRATPWLAVVGEMSRTTTNFFPEEGSEGATSIDLTVLSFMGGPRFIARHNRAEVFSQVLFGAHRLRADAAPSRMFRTAQTGSTTNLATQPGGGVDVYALDNLAVRFAVNLRWVNWVETRTETQIVAGLVYSR